MSEQGYRMLLTRWTVIVTFSWDIVIAWLEVCYMICPILVGKARPIYGALAIGGYVIAMATPSCLTIADLFNSMFQAITSDSFQEMIRKWLHVLPFAQHNIFILQCTTLHCTDLNSTRLSSVAINCTALHCTLLYCTVLYCTSAHFTGLHCTALYYTELNYIALNCSVHHGSFMQ